MKTRSEMAIETLKDMRGRVAKEDMGSLEGRFFVFWGNPSRDEAHRVAKLHRVLDNGTSACHYVVGEAEMINLPFDELPQEIRWYQACRTCQKTMMD